jgi:hypothetical protein
MNKKIFIFSLLFTKFLIAQKMINEPSIGYVYPAGAQIGTSFEIIVGGQNLRGVKEAYFSTPDIKIEEVIRVPKLNTMEKKALIKELRTVFEKRYGRKKNIEKKNEDDEEKYKLPDHPLLKNFEEKTDEELKKIIEIFLTPFRREQIKNSIQEKVIIRGKILENAKPGIYQLRLITALGMTNPLNFYISEFPEVKEKDDIPIFPILNTIFKKDEIFETPIVINGQIMAGDIDRFKFKAKKGQKLVFEVKGREIIPFMADAVPGWFQPVLIIYNQKGEEIIYSDEYYFNPDPVVFYEVEEDGVYEVEIRDALYRGREDFVYRLFIGEKPYITHIFPAGGEKYKKTIVSIYGWNLPTKKIELDTKYEENGVYKKDFNFNGISTNTILYMIDDLPEFFEKEPNDTLKEANEINLPIVINGIISKKGDIDIYKLRCKKGFKIAVDVYSRRLGYPCDTYICILDKNGKLLISNDDYIDKSFDLITHHSDSYIYYEIPEDGIYYIKIFDIQQNGGSEYIYRMRVSEAKPDFNILVYPSSLNIPRGGTIPFDIYVIRKDEFNGEIEVYLKDDIKGLKINGNKIPEGKNKLSLTITADLSFPQNKFFPIEIFGKAEINGKIVEKKAIPCDEMMQAFAYLHLVPSDVLFVFIRRQFQSLTITLDNENGVIKIPSGENFKITGKIRGYKENEKIKFELKDPSDGITISDVEIEGDNVSFYINVDKKIKKGFKENMIIEVFRETEKGQKISSGFLPALSIEVI